MYIHKVSSTHRGAGDLGSLPPDNGGLITELGHIIQKNRHFLFEEGVLVGSVMVVRPKVDDVNIAWSRFVVVAQGPFEPATSKQTAVKIISVSMYVHCAVFSRERRFRGRQDTRVLFCAFICECREKTAWRVEACIAFAKRHPRSAVGLEEVKTLRMESRRHEGHQT